MLCSRGFGAGPCRCKRNVLRVVNTAPSAVLKIPGMNSRSRPAVSLLASASTGAPLRLEEWVAARRAATSAAGASAGGNFALLEPQSPIENPARHALARRALVLHQLAGSARAGKAAASALQWQPGALDSDDDEALAIESPTTVDLDYSLLMNATQTRQTAPPNSEPCFAAGAKIPPDIVCPGTERKGQRRLITLSHGTCRRVSSPPKSSLKRRNLFGSPREQKQVVWNVEDEVRVYLHNRFVRSNARKRGTTTTVVQDRGWRLLLRNLSSNWVHATRQIMTRLSCRPASAITRSVAQPSTQVTETVASGTSMQRFLKGRVTHVEVCKWGAR